MHPLRPFERAAFPVLYRWRLQAPVQAIFRAYGRYFPLRRPLFVIGLNRSGTSIFTRFLAATGAVFNWSEASDMWDPRGYPWERSMLRRPFWPLDPQGHTDAVLRDNGPRYYLAVPGICAMRARAKFRGPGEVRFLNKNPRNVLRMDLLETLFPEAVFVSIVRDPRAVVRSWMEKSIPKLLQHRYSRVDIVEGRPHTFVVDGRRFDRNEMLTRLGESCVYVVSRQLDHFGRLPKPRKFMTTYEDFVADIHGTLRAIDERFDLDPRARRWPEIPPTQDSRNVKVSNDFDEADLATVTRVTQPLLVRLGYSA